jgi:hypothetical protein
MNMGLRVGLMFANAAILGIIPYIWFVSSFSLYKLLPTNGYVLLGIYISVILLTFGLSFGSFALIQQQNCGSVKNIKQVSANAGIATGIQAIGLLITAFVPLFRQFVGSIIPDWLGYINNESIAYGYFVFWFALFGIAIGGSLSGVC